MEKNTLQTRNIFGSAKNDGELVIPVICYINAFAQ